MTIPASRRESKVTSIMDEICQAYLDSDPLTATKVLGSHLDQVNYPFQLIDKNNRLEKRLKPTADPIQRTLKDILEYNRKYSNTMKVVPLFDLFIHDNHIQELLSLITNKQQQVQNRQELDMFKRRWDRFVEMIDQVKKNVLANQRRGYYYPLTFIQKYVYGLQHITVESTYLPLTKWVEEVVIPYSLSLSSWFQKYIIPKCTMYNGLYQLKNGKKLYEACIAYHTGHPYSPEAIHQLGIQLVESLHREQMKLIEQTYPGLSQKEFEREYHFNHSNRFSSSQHMINTAQELLTLFDDQVQRLFQLPSKYKTPLLKTVQNKNAILGWAQAGETNNNRPSLFYVNTASWKDIPKSDLVPFILHEAIPGHAFQFQFNDTPECLKVFTFFTSITEGIGLYAEGCFEPRDIHSMYSRFNYKIWRALRLVVDSGIHCYGWSLEKALAYMKKYCYHHEDILKTEILRYSCVPGQACSYYIGYLDIKQLEKEWREKHPEERDNPYAFFNELLKYSKYSLNAIREILVGNLSRELAPLRTLKAPGYAWGSPTPARANDPSGWT
jgi:uncharacterized protein (DUF885 family)